MQSRAIVSSQFARVVKGVDLRSTARKCAWVRTPQLTQLLFRIFWRQKQKHTSYLPGTAFGNERPSVSVLLRFLFLLRRHPGGFFFSFDQAGLQIFPALEGLRILRTVLRDGSSRGLAAVNDGFAVARKFLEGRARLISAYTLFC